MKDKKVLRHKKAHNAKKENIRVTTVNDGVSNHEITTMLLILIFFIVLVILLFNKSFFKRNFVVENDKGNIEINLPLFTYYKKEKDNEYTFKSIKRKQKILNHLEKEFNGPNYTIYTCANHARPIHFNNKFNFFVYDIKVEGKGFVKTIKFSTGQSTFNKVCETFDSKVPVPTKNL